MRALRLRLRRLLHLGRVRWRRSLQLRVAVITLILAGSVVLVVSLVLFDQIRTQTLDTKRDAAVSQALAGVRYAQNQVVAVPTGDRTSVNDTLDRTVQELVTRGGSAGRFAVVMINRDSATPRASPSQAGLTGALPDDLMVSIGEDNQAYYEYARTPSVDGDLVPSLVVGARVPSRVGTYELYYVFPLDQEERSLSDIRTIVAGSGLALIGLVGGIGYLVTRLVTSPVRAAAGTAEKLASGLLEERLPIRGEDDLAKLAGSFNRMAASLQRQITQLEDLSRLQQRFTSDVSHELRTPLTTVRMAADILHAARRDFPPDVARSAELLHGELDRFEGLLSDLLEISRYDAGAASLDAQPTELAPLVARVVAAALPLARARGAQITVEVPDTPVVAEIDPRRIERILRNLVTNAVTHGGGTDLEIRLAGDARAAAVTVRDRGPGMTREQTTRIFDRFWRADPARSRHAGGTGLGLSISREDARLHHGWLQAWAEEGRGSQFRLTLPLVQDEELESSPLPLEPTGLDRAGAEPADLDRAEAEPVGPGPGAR